MNNAFLIDTFGLQNLIFISVFMFPLLKNDGYSVLSLNRNQREAVKSLTLKILNKEYSFKNNPCQCGNPTSDTDLVIAEKDMFGIPNRNILCHSCGLVRSEKIISEDQQGEYYNIDYKPINYDLSQSNAESYYNAQMYRGKQFYELAEKYCEVKPGKQVYDMGCGAGGVMHYFNEKGLNCKGNDYSEVFLEKGRSIGMDLIYGDMPDSSILDNSIDFFILSHVYEHLIDTRIYLKRIFSKIKVGGVLIMEVPGTFADIDVNTGYPATGFQFAHVINFYHKNFLQSMFEFHGLKVLFGNERCTFVVQKTNEAQFEEPFVYVDPESKNFNRVKAHFIESTKKYSRLSNKIYLKRKLSNLIKGKILHS